MWFVCRRLILGGCPILVYPVGLGLVGSAWANAVAQAISGAVPPRTAARTRPAAPRPAAQVAARHGRDLIIRAAVLSAFSCRGVRRPGRDGRARRAPDRDAAVLLPRARARRVRDRRADAGRPRPRRRGGPTTPAPPPAGSPCGGSAPAWWSPAAARPSPVLLPLFTDDPAVLDQADVVWWFLAAHAAAGRGGLRPRRRAHGRRRRRLPAHRHHRGGARRVPAAVAAGRAARLGPGRRLDRAHLFIVLRLVGVARPGGGDRGWARLHVAT